MSTAIIVGSVVAAEASQDAACKTIEMSFVNQGASVQDRIAFADCIHRLHPGDISLGGIRGVKVAMVLLIVSWVTCAIFIYRRSEWDGGKDFPVAILGGAVGAVCIVLLSSIIFSAFAFLFFA